MAHGNLIDLTGRQFGRLTVIDRAETIDKRTRWNCVCICGNNKNILSILLLNGKTTSCGCKQRDNCKKLFTTHGYRKNSVRSSEYRAWESMMHRCYNPNYIQFMDYGGRGIIVCEEWHKFEAFIEDMGLKPSPKLTLDRIDSNGNYEPSNCRWATYKVQGGNRRNNVWIEYDNKRMILSDWATYLSRMPNVLHKQLKSQTISQIVEKHKKKNNING